MNKDKKDSALTKNGIIQARQAAKDLKKILVVAHGVDFFVKEVKGVKKQETSPNW